MKNFPQHKPTFTIIAGVNGSGKTTFALDYFKEEEVVFINADLIATALSPNNPDTSQFMAGKLMLKNISSQIENKQNFAIETTLASKNYLKIIRKLKAEGWLVNMVYLYLPSVDISIARVAERVKNGGHNIPLLVIKRRYLRSLDNLMNHYLDTLDDIQCFANAKNRILIFKNTNNKTTISNQSLYKKILEYKDVR